MPSDNQRSDIEENALGYETFQIVFMRLWNATWTFLFPAFGCYSDIEENALGYEALQDEAPQMGFMRLWKARWTFFFPVFGCKKAQYVYFCVLVGMSTLLSVAFLKTEWIPRFVFSAGVGCIIPEQLLVGCLPLLAILLFLLGVIILLFHNELASTKANNLVWAAWSEPAAPAPTAIFPKGLTAPTAIWLTLPLTILVTFLIGVPWFAYGGLKVFMCLLPAFFLALWTTSCCFLAFAYVTDLSIVRINHLADTIGGRRVDAEQDEKTARQRRTKKGFWPRMVQAHESANAQVSGVWVAVTPCILLGIVTLGLTSFAFLILALNAKGFIASAMLFVASLLWLQAVFLILLPPALVTKRGMSEMMKMVVTYTGMKKMSVQVQLEHSRFITFMDAKPIGIRIAFYGLVRLSDIATMTRILLTAGPVVVTGALHAIHGRVQ